MSSTIVRAPALFSIGLLVAAASLQAQTVTVIAGNRGADTENYSTALSTTGGLTLKLGLQVDYLVVAGGGGGGGSGTDTTAWGGGGGGGGGLLSGSVILADTSYAVTVGAGGAGGIRSGSVSSQVGGNGVNSVFGNLVALGGGGGGAFKIQGSAGGSGGGGGGRGTGNNLRTAGGAGTSDQGSAGGSSRDDDSTGRVAGGGGGGAGAVGGSGGDNTSVAGNGGAGLASSITGSSVTYAGGGGGGAWDTFDGETAGSGGSGGGGAGSTNGNATSGTNGLGGGGGGVGTQGVGGAGGSGVVIVRWLGSIGTDGGAISSGSGSAAGYTLRTFTSGTDTFDVIPTALASTLSSDISGSGALTFASAGTVVFTGSATHTGGTNVTSGTLKLGNGGAGGSLGGAVALATGAVLEYNRSSDATFGSLSGSGAGTNLIKKGSGSLTIVDGSAYNANINITQGAVLLGSADALDSAVIQLGGGAIASDGAAQRTITNDINAYNTSAILGDAVRNGRLVVDGNLNLGSIFNNRTLEIRSDVVIQGNVAVQELYGAVTLAKTGTGTLTVDGSINNSGLNTVSAGALIVNGSTGSGALYVDSGATLGGSGTIGGNTSISGIHAPGNSPGIQTFSGSLSYNLGSQVLWELGANTESNTPTVMFDQIVVGANLSFIAGTAFNLSFDPTSTVSTVDWSDAFWLSDRSWLVYDVAGNTTGLDGVVLNVQDWLDGQGDSFSSALVGSFSLSQVGQDVYLNYSAVPEPSTYGLLLGGLALAGAAIRRRRKNSK